MADCLFCKLRDGAIPATITHRDDDVLAFKDIKPGAPLHELIIPTRHISSLAASSADDAPLLGKLMLVAAERARAEGFGQGFRVTMNSGAPAGQTVFHVPLHLLAGRPFAWPPG